MIFRAVTTCIALLVATTAQPLSATSQEAPTTGRDTVLSGLYSDKWDSGNDLDAFAKRTQVAVSLGGTFHTLDESENGWGTGATDRLLEQVWSAHATPFANVNVRHTAFEVARGDADAEIGRWATRVRAWLDRGDGRSLLIAPMQEMNGNWVPYGMDPGNYPAAFRRFVDVARYYGLDTPSVRWVFAPNGWSVPPYTMADYYPGDDVVDFVGVSTYNFGSTVDLWTPVDWAIGAALDEIRTFAPDKPYILAQVGSSTSGGDRDAWLRQMFRAASRDPNVVGLVYFNFDKETDWKIWDGTTVAQGWLDGVADASVSHVWPLTGWFQPGPLDFHAHEGRFADDDLLPARAAIDWLAERGIVTGCAEDTFCPHGIVSRAQLATLLVRALDLPPATRPAARDDDGTAHEADIDAVMEAGLMELCAPKRFCPDQPATREALAAAFAAWSRPVDQSADVTHPVTDGPICATPRACEKKSLTRTFVATALKAFLETVPPPPSPAVDTARRRPWWEPDSWPTFAPIS